MRRPMNAISELLYGALCLVFVWFGLCYYLVSIPLGFFRRIRTKQNNSAPAPEETKVVVVTGYDSGFGRMLVADLLGDTKYRVVALTLTQRATEELTLQHNGEGDSQKGDRLLALQCDITKASDVNTMALKVRDELCEKEGCNLYAIVNNAGTVAGVGPLMCYSDDPADLMQNMNVNYFGMLRVTGSLMELLLKSSQSLDGGGGTTPRIINMSSTAGATAVPSLNGAYNASKMAVEGWSDTLAIELAPFSVSVVKIRPGGYATGIKDRWLETMIKKFESSSDFLQGLYGGQAWIDALRKGPFGAPATADPKEVVNVTKHAILCHKPSSSYWVGSDAKTLIRAIAALPTEAALLVSGLLYPGPVKVQKDKDD